MQYALEPSVCVSTISVNGRSPHRSHSSTTACLLADETMAISAFSCAARIPSATPSYGFFASSGSPPMAAFTAFDQERAF